MSVLGWIMTASFSGGALSVIAAAAVALNTRTTWVPMLVSYAIGALLGAAFLDVLPEAFTQTKNIDHMAATILIGILLFFVLEKLVLWHHCHSEVEGYEAHEDIENHDHGHDHGRSGLMITIGEAFHNFVDGILIAAAFMTDIKLGIVTSLAIIAHEIPQEVGDFLILLHSGYSKRQSLLLNMLSSLSTFIGATLAYFALKDMQEWIPTILGLAAASLIYIAVADLIPGLHKRPELHATAQQVTLIGLGIGTIWLTKQLLGDLA